MIRPLSRHLSHEAQEAWRDRQSGLEPNWCEHECDYVIVGAGSSGCVIANRLTTHRLTTHRHPAFSVVLLEAGGSPKGQAGVSDFLLSRKLQQSDLDWQLTTQREPRLEGRRIAWPRGRGLGGSSLLNYMIYMRGSPGLYDSWAGLTGDLQWSYSQLLEYFRRSENNLVFQGGVHGNSGELFVDRCPVSAHEQEFFGAAAEEIGLEFDSEFDFNGTYSRTGKAGFYQHTVKGGRRWSAYDAFLQPVMERENLQVVAQAAVTRVLIRGGRAVAVEYLSGAGIWQRVWAQKEVVLCAGAIDSPRLLKLSGVGSADELYRNGIEVVADLPSVGAHLSDHPVVQLVYPAVSAHAVGDLPCGGLFLSSPRADLEADLQFHPYSFQAKGRPYFCFGVTLVRPKSSGAVKLTSAEPFGPASISANYLSERSDLLALQHGVQVAQEMAKTNSMRKILAAKPAMHFESKRDLEEGIRASVGTLFHPAGSCRMGAGRDSVVDSKLRVHGIRGLRVADASVFPSPVDGNTNASCLLVAERASQLLLES